ncbi:MAG: serine/threonine protein kinase [Planctomycetes bacterium]|nr:serine/threonine protein kinase [Planctomycetota bacterium]MBM4058703.1 serine/threonine protein kinase [Planctomycetota bacterium]
MGLGDLFGSWFGGSGRVDLWRRFERMRESSSGTMSTFYKVRDLKTGEVLGLKVVDAAKAAPVEGRYKSLGKPTEGEIGQQITGPTIVRIKEWGTATTGDPFILQEHVDGVLLHNLIAAKKPLTPAQKIDLVTQAATSIKAVHDAGFVHRDICPRNFILETATGRLVLIDFGLTVPDRPAFLQPGNRVGTPNYMAPEVVRRRQADKRLDIFSFGITAYEICTCRAPWPKGSTGKAALAHDTPPTDIREAWPEIPPPLATAIMACLAADPEARPPSMDRFLGAIAAVKA